MQCLMTPPDHTSPHHGAEWKEVPPPARKADYVDKYLRLLDEVPRQWHIHRAYKPYAPAVEEVVWIRRRLNAKDTIHTSKDIASWGSMRVLEVEWRCPTCNIPHTAFIPEAWLEEGKAVFVEKASESSSCQV